MNVDSCLLVGMDLHSAAIGQRGIGQVFPQCSLTRVDTLEESLERASAPGIELLVLAHPAEKVLASALEATDAAGLRRWAIVILGNMDPVEGAAVISPEQWNEESVILACRSSVAQHELLREKSRLRGDLLTIANRIAHDLRTPLGGMLATGELLKDILRQRDSAAEDLANPLFDSGDTMSRLIGRLSLLTKASGDPLPKETVKMGDVVRDVLQRHEREILRKHAVVLQSPSWPQVQAVYSWAETIWSELVSNALQHGKAGVRIELGWSLGQREVRFWVRDEGDGVPPEKRAKIFQPFHLLHQTNARKGLGLSIVQRLIDLQAGNCGYENISNGGSLFYFALPLETGELPIGLSGLAEKTATFSPSTTPNLREQIPD